MSVPKQGGVLNYLGKQEIVKAPKHWQSSPDSPKTELVYITDAEKGLLMDANLHGSLLDKPNIGPSNLLSFDGWGDAGDFQDFSGGNNNNTTSGNNNNDGPGNQNTGNAREDYIANYSSKGIVKGGGKKIGYDKDNTPIYEDSRVDPEVVQRQKEEYAEQFGGVAPLGSRPVSYSTKYEYNQMKHIADSKLDTIKAKLRTAGFTDFNKDATLSEMKEYVTTLNRTGKIGDSWKNAVDTKGNPLYSPETIAKWEAEGYVPQSATLNHWSTSLLGKVSPSGQAGAPLTYDQLMHDFNTITEVGQSHGMDWQERMKTYSPNQYANMTGQDYNPHTKTFTPRGGGNEQDAAERIAAPYEVGGTAPVASQAAKWYANLGKTNPNTLSFQAQYNAAKTKQAALLGTPSPIRWLAVSQSPYYNFLKENKLDRGIL